MQTETTILVIDDEPPSTLKLLSAFLQQHHFQVRVADSGERGLVALQAELPDLILLDVMMPGIDGFTTCKQIKANKDTTNIPIIFITALDSIDDKISGYDAGGVDYITKPFQQQEVLARINTHITLRRKELELEQALSMVKELSGILPICSYCKKIRDDNGYWHQVEAYIANHSKAMCSHSLCKECMLEHYDEIMGED